MYLKTCSTDIYQLQTIQLYEMQLKDQNNDGKKKYTMNTVNTVNERKSIMKASVQVRGRRLTFNGSYSLMKVNPCY